MNGWRLLIVAASAAAALVVGLGGAQAHPQTDDIQMLLAAVGAPAR